MKLHYRQIRPEDVPPEASQGVRLLDDSIIIGGYNDDGALCAVTCLEALAHLECLWIRKDLRKEKVTIGQQLWKHIGDVMDTLGIKMALALAPQPGIEKVLKGIGGEKLPFPIYQVRR